MDDCVFCQIVAGKLPKFLLYEDADFMSFLDINPINRGHALVIPKTHYRWVHQVEKFGPFWEIAKKIAEAQIVALKADHVNFATLGYGNSHAKIHIIPRFVGDDLGDFIDWTKSKALTEHEMEEVARSLLAGI